jgi:hypothetical protein
MLWMWLNVPLGLLIVLAVAGIPMWMVINHPDTGPAGQGARRAVYRPKRVAAHAEGTLAYVRVPARSAADQRRAANLLAGAR